MLRYMQFPRPPHNPQDAHRRVLHDRSARRSGKSDHLGHFQRGRPSPRPCRKPDATTLHRTVDSAHALQRQRSTNPPQTTPGTAGDASRLRKRPRNPPPLRAERGWRSAGAAPWGSSLQGDCSVCNSAVSTCRDPTPDHPQAWRSLLLSPPPPSGHHPAPAELGLSRGASALSLLSCLDRSCRPSRACVKPVDNRWLEERPQGCPQATPGAVGAPTCTREPPNLTRGHLSFAQRGHFSFGLTRGSRPGSDRPSRRGSPRSRLEAACSQGTFAL